MIVVFIIIIIIVIYYVFPYILKVVIKKRVSERARVSGKVYLTLDDGPNDVQTSLILDYLKKEEVKVSFFLLGSAVERNIGIVQRINLEGHDIGLHGFQHLHAWKVPPHRYLSDIIKGKKSLKPYQQFRKTLFRPAFGKTNIITVLCYLRYLKPVFWDNDPRDYQNTDIQEVSNSVVSQLSSKRIILIHDIVRDDVYMFHLEVLKTIVKQVKDMGYSFGRISELM